MGYLTQQRTVVSEGKSTKPLLILIVQSAVMIDYRQPVW